MSYKEVIITRSETTVHREHLPLMEMHRGADLATFPVAHKILEPQSFTKSFMETGWKASKDQVKPSEQRDKQAENRTTH